MKFEETKKITALGVVIFSFIALLICLVLMMSVYGLTALLVLKTALPETALKIGGVLGSGIGIIASTAFLTKKGRVKGIVSAGIMSGCILLFKILGNAALDMGGYFNWYGFIGSLFTIVFAFIGAVVGSALKR